MITKLGLGPGSEHTNMGNTPPVGNPKYLEVGLWSRSITDQSTTTYITGPSSFRSEMFSARMANRRDTSSFMASV